jgi:exopolysaccharide production protein ExoF
MTAFLLRHRRKRVFGWRSGTTISVALAAVLVANTAADADDYKLGAMDKLRIRVVEWQTTEATIRDWSSVSGEYTVGPSGSISLPFLGDLPAEGKTTEDIATQIGIKLEQQFGLRNRPSASVELSEFRPIFISGDVERPGQYPYTPKLTISKALSLSGGLRRADAGQRFARDFISAKGDETVLMAQRGRLIVRRARLEAEIAQQDQIDEPKELKHFPDAQDLLASENALMASRRKRLTLQLEGLEELKSLIQAEIVALAKKNESQNRQLDLAKDDLAKVDVLAEKGLALSARKLGAEQRAADIEQNLLDIDTNSLTAKQAISKANQDEITLRNDWDNQLAQELQNTESDLDALNLKLATTDALMSEALAQSADASRFDTEDPSNNITYHITRESDGKTQEIDAQLNTLLQPGDLINATVKLYMQ